MDAAEKMAADIALTMNGGEWKDGKWYSKGHREAWIKAVQPYADEIERLREALEEIMHYDVAWHSGKLGTVDGPCAALARAALNGEGE